MKWIIRAAAILATHSGLLMEQGTAEGPVSFSVPITLSGSAMRSGRLQLENPGESAGTAGFRAMFYPTLNLGSNWLATPRFRFANRRTFITTRLTLAPSINWRPMSSRRFWDTRFRRESMRW